MSRFWSIGIFVVLLLAQLCWCSYYKIPRTTADSYEPPRKIRKVYSGSPVEIIDLTNVIFQIQEQIQASNSQVQQAEQRSLDHQSGFNAYRQNTPEVESTHTSSHNLERVFHSQKPRKTFQITAQSLPIFQIQQPSQASNSQVQQPEQRSLDHQSGFNAYRQNTPEVESPHTSSHNLKRVFHSHKSRKTFQTTAQSLPTFQIQNPSQASNSQVQQPEQRSLDHQSGFNAYRQNTPEVE
eukprot:446379_1